MIRFEVPGIAVPQARHRTTKTGHSYIPKPSNDYRSLLKLAASKAWGDKPPSEDMAELLVTVVLPPLKSFKKPVKQKLEAGGRIPKTTRPDADNYLKQASDAVSGIIVADDAQFWKVMCRKFYGARPVMEVLITFDGD